MSEIKPALTKEEWMEYLSASSLAKIGIQYMYHARHDWRPHALAALCLVNQPFGFTRDMLLVLQDWIAEKWADALFNERDATAEEVFRGMGGEIAIALAAHLEALLPPEDDEQP